MRFLVCFIVFFAQFSFAERFLMPVEGVDVVGVVRQVKARDEDTLLDIGRAYSVGVSAMKNANPGVDMWYPGADSLVLVPTRYILPEVPREGIVINLPEMRLYYFAPNGEEVRVYAIGIGREGRDTPLGVQRITEMRKDPSWTPPASIRAEHAAQGDILPAVVPPGPDNPLGTRAMRLTNPSYLIHGTAKPWGVGMRVSSGCIRMYPEGVEELFDLVRLGEKVNIIDAPMKLGWHADALYLEYHPPLPEHNVLFEEAVLEAQEKIAKAIEGRNVVVNHDLVRAVIQEAAGMPVMVAM